MAGMPITTICVVGFPADHGVAPRELKNFCRWMNGFEGSHVAFQGAHIPSTLFVKFQTHEHAMEAMELLQGVPFDIDNPATTLKAEWARREMEVRANSPLPSSLGGPLGGHVVRGPPPAPAFSHAPQHHPPQQSLQTIPASGGYAGPPSKRLGSTGGELVTIVVFGVREKGLQPAEIEQFFQERQGYVTSQHNDRIDALFVKYHTQQLADQAMNEANHQQIGAEWARRNLDDDRGGGGHAPPQPQQGHLQAYPGAPPQAAPPPGPRMGTSGEELVTIVVMNIKGKEITPSQLQEWFMARPGYERHQQNDRIGALFIKFLDPWTAEQALNEANTAGLGAEWARRNLDDDLSARHSMQAQSMPPQPLQYQGPPRGLNGPSVAVPQYGHQPYGGGKGGGPGYQGGGAAYQGPPKRIRTMGGEIDTITILFLGQKQQQHGDLQPFVSQMAGYVTHQVHEKIDAMFVKFQTRQQAERALMDANNAGISAEWARRNLDL